MVACGSGVPAASMATPPMRASVKREVVAAELGDGFEDADGFAGDFGADAVAGEDCDFELHGTSADTRYEIRDSRYANANRQPSSLRYVGDFSGRFVQQRDDVLVVDGFFAVGEFGEAGVDLVEFGFGKLVAQFGEAVFECAAAGVLAEHDVLGR